MYDCAIWDQEGSQRVDMPENEPIRRFVPLPTQFLQEEEPSDVDEDDDEQNAEDNQPLTHFQHPATCSPLISVQDHHVQPLSSARGISTSTFYGISQRNVIYGQNHTVADDMPSGQTQRNFIGRHVPRDGDCSQISYDYQEVFDDPHQLIPSYHEYSITSSPTHSCSPTPGDSAGIPEYFISRGSAAVRPVGLGYGSHGAEQGDTIFCEPQQRLQEPKVISNERNRYTIVGHTVEGQPIYALQSVRPQDRPRLHQGSLYRVMESNPNPRYVFLRQQVVPGRRTQRDCSDIASPNENYRAVAREIVAKALEDKRQKQQCSQEPQPSSSGISSAIGKAKKKLVSPDEGGSEKISGSAVAAQVAAIQRFSTPLGWKQMGSWLKTAEANEDWARLKLLLSQCLQANLTLELLQSNDTPKFVRKLSKTCPDQDVRKISGDLVIRWKRLISTPANQSSEGLKKVGSAKRKTPHVAGASKAKVKKDNLDSMKVVDQKPESDGSKQKDVSGNKVESSKKVANIDSPERSDDVSVKSEKALKASSHKNKTDKSGEPAKTTNKLNEFNMFEKLGEERKEKKRRPKTAKTYTSKFRSTGLEGDEEVPTNISGAGMVAASKKKGSVPSKALLDAKKRTALPTSIPKGPTVGVSPPFSSSASLLDKKPAPNAPARVMMSNTFMDALMDPGHKKAPPKQTRKRPTLNLKSSTSVIPSVMEGLYSDTSRSLNKEKLEEGSGEEKKDLVVEEPDIVPIGNRKIRFADENGQELVEVRYFEVEEGERLNVSRLSSEDMKHLEMQRERTFMKEQRSLHITEFGFHSGRSEGITHIPWKLVPLTDAVFFERRGSQSEAKKIEEERQKTIMMPFYDPSLPAELADAEPELLTDAILPPTEIPLEAEANDEDINQDIAQAFGNAPITTGASANHSQSDGKEIDVQKLMTELKKKGLVGSSSDLASILNKVSSTTTPVTSAASTSVPTVSQVAVATTPTYTQLNTQMTTHSSASNILNMSMPPPRFPQGLPMPPVLPTGQYVLPIQQQQPLLNGPVPAGVTPTVGVDLTTHSGPSTSEAPSYGAYGRPAVKQCTFFQSGTCSYGARCRFAHGDEPTVGTQGYGYSDERGRNFRRGGQPFRGAPRRGGADGGYRRGRGGPLLGRRGFYDRDREKDRDREREYDYDRRVYDRYPRRRRRSLSRSRSRSRSRSVSPFERRPYSPDRRRRGSPCAMCECDQEQHFEKHPKEEDRERGDQHSTGVENQLADVKPQLQEHYTGIEKQCAIEGSDYPKAVALTISAEQRKSPPEDPLPLMKIVDNVQAVVTDSPASPSED